MVSLESSRLDTRIIIQSNTEVEDELYGTQPSDWRYITEAWAEVQDVLPSKSESIVEGALVSYRRTRIRFRYRKNIDSSMRIVEKGGLGRIWQIIAGPAILGSREGIELLCEEYSIKES